MEVSQPREQLRRESLQFEDEEDDVSARLELASVASERRIDQRIGLKVSFYSVIHFKYNQILMALASLTKVYLKVFLLRFYPNNLVNNTFALTVKDTYSSDFKEGITFAASSTISLSERNSMVLSLL